MGFDAENVLLAKVDLNNAKVPESQQSAVREEILARLRALPGVTSASQSIVTPQRTCLHEEQTNTVFVPERRQGDN